MGTRLKFPPYRLLAANIAGLVSALAATGVLFAGNPGSVIYVTDGTQFTIAAADLGVEGLSAFEKKPKVYVEYTVESSAGKVTTKTKQVKILTKTFPATEITCKWTEKLSAGQYPLLLLAKGSGAPTEPIVVTGDFFVTPPSISSIAPDHAPIGYLITVAGEYFGERAPSIWLEWTDSSGKTVKKNCKAISNTTAEDGKSSTLTFNLPKIPSLTVCSFNLKNIIGEASIVFLGINTDPVANDDSATTTQSVPVELNPLGNDTDADGDSLVIVSVGTPSSGKAEIIQDGLLVLYTPNDGFVGADSFTYKISDGHGGYASATISVNVLSSSESSVPVAMDDAAGTISGSTVEVNVLANDFDPAGYALTIVAVSTPAHGAADITSLGKLVVYTPEADYVGNDSFTYRIGNSYGGYASATVTIAVASPGKNHDPVAVDDVAASVSGVKISINVLANDSDPDGDSLSVSAVGSPSHGVTLVASDSKSVSYTPSADYVGSDLFSYSISDGRGGAASAKVHVTVTSAGKNHDPVAKGASASVAYNTATEIAVIANDYDPDGDSIKVASVGAPSHGSASVTADASKALYTPSSGYIGRDSFTYTISDGRGGSATATVKVDVADPAGNHYPVAVDDIGFTSDGTAVVVDVLANDSDPDGNPLTVLSVTAPGHGAAAVGASGKNVTYTPSSGYFGVDSFTYTIGDGLGGSATASVTMASNFGGDGACLVIDVSGGTSARVYPSGYLASIPADILTNDNYKTNMIVLAKIPAGSFTMGSPETELGRSFDETRHTVNLSSAFFIGMFEVTQTQWAQVKGTSPSFYASGSHPVENISWDGVRGGSWPGTPSGSGAPDATSFIGVLRSKAGLKAELPTEAQWEYASRAGTTAALFNGKELSNLYISPELDGIAWYDGNSYTERHRAAGTAGAANAWGLYDTLGNVWELCLDYYGDYGSTTATDPVGALTGTARVVKGGAWSHYARSCRSAIRSYNSSTAAFSNQGFRLCVWK